MVEKTNRILAHTSWGAIFAGAVLALAIQFMLSLLGVGLGLVSSDIQDGVNMSALGWGAGIWLAVTFLFSLFSGGYVASRLSSNTLRFAGSLNSMVVWALVVGLNLVAAGSGVSRAAGAFSNTIGSVTSGLNLGAPSGMITGIDFQGMQEEIDQVLSETNNEELKSLVRQEYQDIKSAAQNAATSILQRPGEMREIVNEFGNRAQSSLRQINEELKREDLAQVIASQTNMSEQEAQTAVSKWQNRIQDWSQNFQAKLNQAQDEALKQAQQAADASGKIALYAFFTLLLGLIAAVIGGGLGTSRSRADIQVDR